MGLFKRRPKLKPNPPPGDLPEMPLSLSRGWEGFAESSEEERQKLIDAMAEWEAVLAPEQQSALRVEITSKLLSEAGSEVAEAWADAGMDQGYEKGWSAMVALVDFLAAELRFASKSELVWSSPIQTMHLGIRNHRDRLIKGAEEN